MAELLARHVLVDELLDALANGGTIDVDDPVRCELLLDALDELDGLDQLDGGLVVLRSALLALQRRRA